MTSSVLVMNMGTEMKWLFNIFSGHSYTESDQTRISEEGRVYNKFGNDWLADNGDLIQRDGNQFMNTRTGVRSESGDPFED